jgi:hypothetical protein
MVMARSVLMVQRIALQSAPALLPDARPVSGAVTRLQMSHVKDHVKARGLRRRAGPCSAPVSLTCGAAEPDAGAVTGHLDPAWVTQNSRVNAWHQAR